jgi:probable rRNA maturation factor
MIEIQQASSISEQIDRQLISKAISNTLNILKKPEMDITLRLIDDDEMRMLNETFRGEDKTTDVLSFTQDVVDPETGRTYLGDILISLPTAKKQAQDLDHPLDQECAFLAIHGTLHLLGYDHYDPEEKEEMWSLQDQIFETLSSTTGEDEA